MDLWLGMLNCGIRGSFAVHNITETNWGTWHLGPIQTPLWYMCVPLLLVLWLSVLRETLQITWHVLRAALPFLAFFLVILYFYSSFEHALYASVDAIVMQGGLMEPWLILNNST
jgi:DMSO/TMAO reductase YedYZ heme-binding membrane subunit